MTRSEKASWGDSLGREARVALRGLARRPLFAATVILTLALGIGANTAIFSAVDAVLLHPLPVPALDRLVTVYDDLPGINLPKAPLSPAEALDLSARSDLFDASAAYQETSLTLTGLDQPRRVAVTATTGRFFGLFGARPHLGRLYAAEESAPGRDKVAVLGHAFWRELTGGDPGIIGRALELNGQRYEVIGVLPPDLRFPRKTEVWIPFELEPRWLSREKRASLFMTFVGRRQPGLTSEQLAGRLHDEASRWHERLHYDPSYRHTLVSEPFVDSVAGPLRPVLLVLLGAVGLVLLIACANVASLQLVRAVGREREMAVRAALGARRWPIVRQLLTESLALAAAGGALGLLLGYWTIRLLVRWNGMPFEALRELRLDPTVLAFTAGVTLLAAVLFGLLPALRAAGVSPQALKESARGASGGSRQKRTLQGSVVVQLALTLVLLLASALTAESLSRLLTTDPGFHPEGVMTMSVGLPSARYPEMPERTRFFEALAERLAASPGVRSAGLVAGLPFAGDGDSSPFEIKGRPRKPGEPERHANIRVVAGDYFRTLGIPRVRGRLFDDTDPPRRPRSEAAISAVIDASLAEKYFPGEDPVGRTISQGPDAVIVGVVGSVRDSGLDQAAYPTVYYLYRQYPLFTMSIAVRSGLPAGAVAKLARSAVAALDPQVPLYDVQPLEERMSRSLATRRLAMAVLAGFAALSLLLAVLGVYGVIGYGVSQRTREIGIRMALGARPGDVERMVLADGLLLSGLGAAAGTLVFLGLGRVLEALLYGVGPRNPAVLAGGVALLGAVAALASYGPAQRAARVEPVVVLRGDAGS